MEDEEHLEWKRAQIAVRKFSETTSVHLDMLTNHRKTIDRLRLLNDNEGIIREKCNADRTIRQVVNDVQQMTLLGARLDLNDLFRFELEVNPLKRKVESAVGEFLAVCEKHIPRTPTKEEVESRGEEEEVSTQQFQLQTTSKSADLANVTDEVKRNAEAYEHLLRDVSELNETMKELATLIDSQHRTVERIETNVDKTLDNVKLGEKYLKEVVKYKITIYGALIGAALGGPAGLIVGVKTGALAAIGGSALGAFGSRLYKKRVASTESSRRNSQLQENEESGRLTTTIEGSHVKSA